MQEKIHALAKTLHPEIVGHRRHLHAHPELAFNEHKTAAYVVEQLQQLGVPIQTGVAKTGVVALIQGTEPDSQTIALRADMDALPILEANDVPYKSTVDGVMHACGHDVHTSSLLGAAKILHEVRDQFKGTIKLIFQPSEEKLPGGASVMIEEGVLDNPAPASIIGQHVMPLIEAGSVGFCSGMYMASADEIFITVKGKGGHAAMPQDNIDPVLITSHLIVALQQVVSRHANPLIPSILSFGKVIANGATNVIPNEVKIEGTFRTLNEEWRAKAHEKIEQITIQLVESMGGSCDLEILKGYPFLTNEPELTARAKSYAIDYLGQDKVVDLGIWMASEDFAYYSQALPGCFYRLGVRNTNKGITSPVHTPTFDVDETALETGMGLMAWMAVQELNRASA